MRRRTLIILLLAAALPLLLLGAVVLLRAEVALLAFDRWLGARGMQGSVAALHIGWERVELHGLRVEDASARRVELRFEPLRLLRGELPAVRVEGLELPLDLSGEGPPLGSLQALLGASAPDARQETDPWRSPLPERPPSLPPLQIEDARLPLLTPVGPLLLELWGQLDPGDGEAPDRLALSFAAQGASEAAPELSVVGALDLSLRDLRPTDLRLDAEIGSARHGGGGTLRLAADEIAIGAPLRLSGELEGAAAALAALLPETLPRPRQGRVDLAVDARLAQPPLPYLDTAPPADWAAWVAGLDLEADLDLAAAGLDLPETLSAGSLRTSLALRREEGRTLLSLREALEADLRGLGPNLLAALPPEVAGRLQPGVSLRLEPAEAEGAALLRLPGSGDDRGMTTAAAGLSLALHAGGSARAELALETPWPAAAAGAARLRVAGLEAEAEAMPLAETLSLSGEGEIELEPRGFAAAARLRLEAVGTAPAERLEASIDLTLAPEASGFLLRFDLDATAEGTPAAESLRLRAEGRAEGLPSAATLQAELDLAAAGATLAGITAETLRITAPLRLDYRGDRLELVADGPVPLLASDLRGEAIEPLARLELVLERLELALGLTDELPGRIALEAALAPLSLGLVGLPVEGLELRPRPLRLEASFDAEGPTDGLVEIELESLVVPERQLTLADLRAELPLGPETPLLRVLQLRVFSDAVPALFPPLDVTATLQDDLHFEARARALEGALDLRARGRHDLERRRGEASLTLAPLAFAPEGLQPAALLALAEELSGVAGRLQGEARVAWNERGVDGTARLVGEELDFSYGESRVEGLAFDIALDGLQPPRAAAPQRITARRIDAGLPPLTDVEAAVALGGSPVGNPELLLRSASAGFAGGRLRLVDGSLDPAGGRYAARLEIEEVELEPLLALLGMAELRGSGRVSGALPVELRDGAIAIREGLVIGQEQGVIAFTSPEARDALAAGGEAVSLMFDALEDFRYEVLEIGLDKAFDGETQVRLRLLGANPEVLEGHPFDLNINLETDTTPLLAALAEGRRIQRGVMDELWRLVR